MPRPRRDGTPCREPLKKKFTDSFITGLKPDSRLFIAYDTHQRGLAVTVQPKSGTKSWKALYYAPGGRPRWYHIGDASAIGLRDARKIAAGIMLRAAVGEDPVAQRRADRSRGTFEELQAQYLEQHAKKKNKSWRQADSLVRRYVLPKWAKLQAAEITRADAKAMLASIAAPVLANQVLDLLAQAPLRWMMQKAESHGLSFRSEVNLDGDALTAQIADSYKEFMSGWYAKVFPPLDRTIGQEPEVRENGTHINVNETIDASVFQRWRADPTYRPASLVEWARRKKADPAQLQTSVRADDPRVAVPDQ